MAIIDSILQRPAVEKNQPQPSWITDLIEQRGQEKRKIRTPVGFDFKREPFDPSSYYRQLGSFRDISRAATQVTTQNAMNKEQAIAEAEFAANQKAMQNAMGGINPNYTYTNIGGGSSGGGGGSYNGKSHKYGLKGVTSNVGKAANYWGGKYGIKTIGGLGPGSVPGSDHPSGHALDFMINNIKGGKKAGTSLANDLISNYKKWNVKYIIWNKYIWHPGRGWHKYSGPSDHTDHVHVSFNK